MNSSKPILLVEDDSVDAVAVGRALRDQGVPNGLIRARDARDALKYLQDAGSERPCLILLDLNMPGTSGLEFLKNIKADTNLKKMPVVVLTTSQARQDINESFNLGVAGYMTKPIDYKKFAEALETINRYWTLSELPDER